MSKTYKLKVARVSHLNFRALVLVCSLGHSTICLEDGGRQVGAVSVWIFTIEDTSISAIVSRVIKLIYNPRGAICLAKND